MTEATDRSGLSALYDGLSRYQWLLRRLSRARDGEGLEMHKRLGPADNSDGPPAGTAGLHGWLAERVGPLDGSRVLELGCGFGALSISWARDHGASCLGLTLSRVQARHARAQAQRLGLAERCDFRVQSYAEPVEGAFDVAVSVESLFHAEDLASVLRGVRSRLRDGASLSVIEDMAVDAGVAQSAAARQLIASWHTSRIYTEDDYRRAFEDAGFEITDAFDLTDQVMASDEARIERSRRRFARARSWLPLPGIRQIVDSFAGGVELEHLYRVGAMRYRFLQGRCAQTAK